MTNRISFAAAVAASFGFAAAAHAQADPDVMDTASICEDGYSVTDVDNNGIVTTIEMNAYAEKSVTDMDADQSGTVSKNEYVNCNNAMSGSASAPSERTADDMAAMDMNADGSVDMNEYMRTSAEMQQKGMEGDAGAAMSADRYVFLPENMKDSDSAAMSQDEYSARAGMMFRALDTDQDSALTQDEFMANTPPMVDISETLNRDFDAMDTDQSGDLTTTELIAANEKRAEAAMASDSDNENATMTDVGAPVVYYRYPSPM